MKRPYLILLLVLILAACTSSSPTATPEPPTAAPTQPPAATEPPPAATEPPPTQPPAATEAAGAEPTTDPQLVLKSWAWEVRDPNGTDVPAVDVPNPENYTLSFKTDGTFNAKVDCNSTIGAFTTFAPDVIAMDLGPSTLAACPSGSLADEMLKMFDTVENYRIEENGNLLVLVWKENGPLDYFRLHDPQDVDLPHPGDEAQTPTATVTAPDGIFLRTGPGTNYPYLGAAALGDTGEIIGVSDDGKWWQLAAPNLPGGQVWGSAAFIEAQNTANVPVVAAHAVSADLVGIPWEWVSTEDPAQGTVYVNDPSRYLIHFEPDNTATIQADCNHVQATYTLNGSSLTITLGTSTRAACPPDSRADAFLQQLANVRLYHIQGGNLFMDQFADGGTMRYVPQGAPVPAPDAPAAKADAYIFNLVTFGPQAAPQPIIPGTTITAHWAGNVVTGFAGCNNYSGTVTPVGTYYTVSNVVSTLKSCPEPAGVMEQESAYLAALQSLTGYQWQSEIVNGIEIITLGRLFYRLPGGGDGVMNFNAVPAP